MVHRILDILEENDLYLKPKKYVFEQDKIEYLGVTIGKGKLCIDPKKLKGVANYRTPKNTTDVQAFLGLCRYYRYFIPKFSEIAARPLLILTKKSEVWHWDEPQIKVFETLKTKMCSVPVLYQPNFKKKFYLQTNTSSYSMGAALLQEGDIETSTLQKCQKPVLHPITYHSATFTPTKRNYDIYERELLAMMKSLVHW